MSSKLAGQTEYLLGANEARSCEVGARYFFWFNFQTSPLYGEGVKTQKNLDVTNGLVEKKCSLPSRTCRGIDQREQRRNQKMTKETAFALCSFLSKPQALL